MIIFVDVVYIFVVQCSYIYVAKVHIMWLSYGLTDCILVFNGICGALIYILWFFSVFKWSVNRVCIVV